MVGIGKKKHQTYAILERAEQPVEYKKCFSAEGLKWIALAVMTVQHIAVGLYPWYKRMIPEIGASLLMIVCMIIGMIAMPIVCFVMVQGIYHTADWKKYALRLLVGAVVSHVPYALFTGTPLNPFSLPLQNHTGVMWTLLCGVMAYCCYMRLNCVKYKWLMKIRLELMLGFLVLGIYGDWGICAALAVCVMAIREKDEKKEIRILCGCWLAGGVVAVVLHGIANAVIMMGFWGAVPFLNRYNGKRSNRSIKLPVWKQYFFYGYYPAHLMVIYGIRCWLGSN